MDEFVELSRTCGRALAAMLAGAPRLHSQFTENSALVLTGEQLPVLNVLLIGPDAMPEHVFEEFVSIARRRDCPLFAVFTSHVAERLAPHAARLGFAPHGVVPMMVLRDAANSVPQACLVERVTDWPSIRTAIDLRARGFGYAVEPTLRTIDPEKLAAGRVEIFVGSRDGVPMSTVTATEAGDAIGIWSMATPAEHQRKGVGRSLLAQVIGDYRRRGASRFYLGASEAGRPVYESLGFEAVGEWHFWTRGM